MNSISDVLASSREIGEVRKGPRSLSLGGLKLCECWSRVCSDVLSLIAAQGLAIAAIRDQLPLIRRESIAGCSLLLILFAVGTLQLLDSRRSVLFKRPEQELASVVKALSAVFALIYLETFLFLNDAPFRHWAIGWFVSALPIVLMGRFIVRAAYVRLWKAGYSRKRVTMVAAVAGLRAFQRNLAIQRFRGYELLGLIPARDSDSDAILDADVPVLGQVDDWRAILESAQANVVVIDLNETANRNGLILDILSGCRQLGIEVELANELFREYGGDCEIDYYSGSLRFRTTPAWSTQLQRACKFLLDLAIGLIGSILTILIAPVICGLIYLEDRGPLFHRREFVGSDGRIHYYLKFRTMVRDADAVIRGNAEMQRRFAENHKLSEDPSILKVGHTLRKFSIDEFQQFFSVLTGQLTFVGPRVIAFAETERYGKLMEKRLMVKPGLTGYWQVNGRQATSYEDRIAMDMFYIDHWSIWLDLVIIGKTICGFLSQEGAI
jgi:exopolysaccharide biosynthesis polyprenyl glycosylphosphotransferase